MRFFAIFEAPRPAEPHDQHGNGINRRFAPIPTDFMKKDPQTYAVIGAAMEVHRELADGGGVPRLPIKGFLEAVYQDGLTVELTSLN